MLKAMAAHMARSYVINVPGRAPVPTPAPSLVTSRGQLPNLPTELLAQCFHDNESPLLLQVPVVDWFCFNANGNLFGADVVSNAPHGNGIRSFASLPSAVTILALRTACTSEFITTTPGRALAVSTESPSHRPSIKPGQIVSLHRALHTDFFEAPSDAPPLLSASKKTISRSVDRSSALLKETLLEMNPEQGGKSTCGTPQLFIPIQGGVDPEQRIRSTAAAVEICDAHPGQVGGFTLAGFYAGECPDARWAALEAAVKHLPEGPLRILPGYGGAPCDVLQAVRRGVDIVESAYPFLLAASGYSLDLSAGVKHNMRDRVWEFSSMPLLPGCSCIACRKGSATGGYYTRSYIRHLLEVHEMLGETLLVAHNFRNYLDWFANLRHAINAGRFEEFCSQFLEAREKARNENKLTA